VHYVPWNKTTLLDRIRWAQSHPSEAQLISYRAQEWARTWVNTNATYLYLRTLMHQYAELQRFEVVPPAGSIPIPNHDFGWLDRHFPYPRAP
jgi:hypothetical protein